MVEQVLKADTRCFSDEREGEIECRSCRARIKILPYDVREGFCYDCLDHWKPDTEIFFLDPKPKHNSKLDDFC
ncbi:MAG: hypothetical protein N3F63_02295 [Thermoplasmata archaeon]|nr:hypothetical protein [Thermoplasmata archaeon]